MSLIGSDSVEVSPEYGNFDGLMCNVSCPECRTYLKNGDDTSRETLYCPDCDGRYDVSISLTEISESEHDSRKNAWLDMKESHLEAMRGER